MSRPKKRQVRKVYRNYWNMLTRNNHHETARFKMNYQCKARVRCWEKASSEIWRHDRYDNKLYRSLVNQNYLENKRSGNGFNKNEYRRKLFKIKHWREAK